MARRSTWFILALFGSCFVGLLIYIATQLTDTEVHFGNKIALIELDGEIVDSRDIVRQFKKFQQDASVQAIVFRIDSPGGGITPSQEIYDIIKKTRAMGKPVIASMGNVAASGGYYVACAADSIVANSGTITGSIGVIIQYPNVDKLLDKIGVKFNTIKSGQFKDILSPYRDMTNSEGAYMHNFVMNAYYQFLQTVSESRGIDTVILHNYADGRVFTGEQAKSIGLVDIIGTYDDAIKIAAKRAGMEGEPQTIKERKRRPSLFEMFFDEDAESKVKGALSIPDFKSYPTVSYKFGF